jgi:hypothetical protein
VTYESVEELVFALGGRKKNALSRRDPENDADLKLSNSDFFF